MPSHVCQVLERGTPAERAEVVAALVPQIVSLSMHKFASNVIEKCLTHCLPPERDTLIKAILAGEPVAGSPGSNPPLNEGEELDGEVGYKTQMSGICLFLCRWFPSRVIISQPPMRSLFIFLHLSLCLQRPQPQQPQH